MKYILNWGEKNQKNVTKEEAEKTIGSFMYDDFYKELYVRTASGRWAFVGEV